MAQQEVQVKHNGNHKGRMARFLSPLEEMEREFEAFMPRRWMHPFSTGMESYEGKMPSVDLIDQEKTVLVRAELPGVEKKDLDISITDDTICIKGKTAYEDKEEEGDYYRHEISRGSYSRTLAIPANVDGKKAKASFSDGVLEVKLPKTTKSNRRKISVE